MDTENNHAAMRESFSLVQNILLIDCTDILPAHLRENMVEKLWESMQFSFLIWFLIEPLVIRLSRMYLLERVMTKTRIVGRKLQNVETS